MAGAQTRRFDRSLVGLGGAWRGRVEMRRATSAVAHRPADGSLLTLLACSRALVPWSLHLPPCLDLPGAGDEVVLERRRVGWHGQVVTLSGAGVELGLPVALSLSRQALGRHLDELPVAPRTRALLEASGGSGLDDTVTRRAGLGLRRLCRCLIRDDAAEAKIGLAVAAMAGLGPGLTPTGDDLLVGVAGAARRLAGARGLGRGRLEALAQALDALPAVTTTPVGRQMLSHAARGRFPEPLPRLLAALGDADVEPAALAGLAEAVAALGSWSGCDMLAGALGLTREWLEAGTGACP